MKAKLYKVSFSFNESYRPKTAGLVSVSTVVEAANQFDALAVAWSQLVTLPNLPDEAASFNAERCDKE